MAFLALVSRSSSSASFQMKVHAAFGDDDAVGGDGDLDLALELQAAFGQGQLQGALVIYFHAVEAQLALDVNAGADGMVGQWPELVAFG